MHTEQVPVFTAKTAGGGKKTLETIKGKSLSA